MDGTTNPGPGVFDVSFVTGGVSATVCNCCRPWAGFGPPITIACAPMPSFQTITTTLGAPHGLSDADVDRIARRTLELQSQLLAGVRALHEMVDQTDPNDPIGAALTRAGLEVKP